MSVNYTAHTILCCLSLAVLCLLVHENARLRRRDKQLLYLAYLLVALSALAEFFGVLLNGREEYPVVLLRIAKWADYTLTPMAGGALVVQMRPKKPLRAVLEGVLGVNTAFQLVAAFGGWMVTIDEHNRYSHGPLYGCYMAVYLSIFVLVLVQFILYGRSFRKQNRASLYGTMLLVIAGIVIQEAMGGDARVSYTALSIGAMLLFIHYTEYGAMAMDDNLKLQQQQIDTDALTGVMSRAAYHRALEAFDKEGALPRGLAAFTIDINGVKKVNDTLGHQAGDELICGAAECIQKALNAEGRCYRTGGDEFVVLTSMNREEADRALVRLKEEAAAWHGKNAEELSVAAGFALAAEYPDVTAERLVRESDNAMYEDKAGYYQTSGRDRRKRR